MSESENKILIKENPSFDVTGSIGKKFQLISVCSQTDLDFLNRTTLQFHIRLGLGDAHKSEPRSFCQFIGSNHGHNLRYIEFDNFTIFLRDDIRFTIKDIADPELEFEVLVKYKII